MKQLLDACHYRGPLTPPGSAASLAGAMGNSTGQSLTALLRVAGPFIPARDAYGFSNNGEGFTLEDAAVLRNIYQGVLDNVSLLGVDALRTALDSFSFDVPVLGATGLPAVAIDTIINQVSSGIRNQLFDAIIASIPGKYGRCGGLAFSAFDFFLAGWPIDKSDRTPPGSGDLRDYIFTRLIDSLQLNAATFLEWLMILRVLPAISVAASAALGALAGTLIGGPVGAALGAFLGGKNDVLGMGGAGPLLLGKTRDQLNQLARQIAHNAAWPVGIIHGGSGSPTDQHQVLAVGYRQFENKTGVLNIWDNNWGNVAKPSCRLLALDLSGSELMVYSSDPDLTDIKGIICETYSPTIPPFSLRIPWTPDRPVRWNVTDCS
jgi:hypothetical protein